MVRYSFLVRLSHPLLHAGLSRRILDYPIRSAPLSYAAPSQPKQHWDFHQTERRLTSHRSGDIARPEKKVFKIPILSWQEKTMWLIRPWSRALSAVWWRRFS